MTIQQQVNEKLKEAMKGGDTELRDSARIVKGEFQRVSKEVPDERAILMLKKNAER
jgi:uncharacterized protein YqeY